MSDRKIIVLRIVARSPLSVENLGARAVAILKEGLEDAPDVDIEKLNVMERLTDLANRPVS